jgi:hypothetical protein
MRWGFKEIRYGYNDMVFLRDLFPASQFVFILRNPLDTIASMMTAWNKDVVLHEKDLYEVLRSKIELHSGRMMSILDGIKQRCQLNDGYIVRYEDLVSDPYISVANVCGFLNILSPDAKKIAAIASDVRMSAKNDFVREMIRTEFAKHETLRELLGLYRELGYNIDKNDT